METLDYFRFAAALLFVISLIGVCYFLLRRYHANAFFPGQNSAPRLEIVEKLMIDANHQAVILRRDQVEHLVIKGGGSILLVESGFSSSHSKTLEIAPEIEDSESQTPKFDI